MFQNQLFLTFCLFCTFPITKVTAQITPDNTLGVESSIVTPVDGLNDEIQGGAARGSNLFHSFTEFNVGEGRGVDFVNPNSIDNIITRVTGNNISNIFGKLGVLGNANLFLINPNGIIFGEGARLDMGGSFYGSTAERVLFPDNIEFSATNPQASTLTINVPIGLGLGNNPGTIINRSNFAKIEAINQGTNSDSTKTTRIGLGVNQGKNFVLIGGDIFIKKSAITAPGGRVTLGGLSQAGKVYFNPDGSLVFPENIDKANVTLTNIEISEGRDNPTINVLSNGGGFIHINAYNLTLSKSKLLFGIESENSINEVTSRGIHINANSINFDNSRIVGGIYEQAIGVVGDINLEANSINFNNDSKILFGVNERAIGTVGNVNLQASYITFDNGSEISTGIYTENTEGKGSIGDTNLTANSISLNNGSQITLLVHDPGRDEIGNIHLNADSIYLDRNSRILSGVFFDGKGRGADINIKTKSLHIANESRIYTSTDIETKNRAGDIIIKATDLAEITHSSRIYSETGGLGDAGDIDIRTSELELADSSEISANNFVTVRRERDDSTGEITLTGLNPPGFDFGKGDAGEINIKVDNLKLDQAKITALSNTGNGGDITLTIEKLLSLANNSEISTNAEIDGTNAGIDGTPGDGGNINIDAGFIFAMPGENSDITANSFSGNGGQININAVGIFNLEAREEATPGNDITAFSQTEPNLNGQINLNTLEIEPSRQLLLLPTQPLNAQIAQACTPGTKEARSEFVFTGRSGIAPNTLEALQIYPPIPDWVEFSPQLAKPSQPKLSTMNPAPSTNIVEAQGWVKDKNGEVILVADAANVTSHDSWQKPKQCSHN